jgi:hypothetical protein
MFKHLWDRLFVVGLVIYAPPFEFVIVFEWLLPRLAGHNHVEGRFQILDEHFHRPTLVNFPFVIHDICVWLFNETNIKFTFELNNLLTEKFCLKVIHKLHRNKPQSSNKNTHVNKYQPVHCLWQSVFTTHCGFQKKIKPGEG